MTLLVKPQGITSRYSRVVATLVAWLHEPAHASLRRAFTVWLRRVLLPARLPEVSIPDVQDFTEVHTMLAERVMEWTQQLSSAAVPVLGAFRQPSAEPVPGCALFLHSLLELM